MENKKLLIAPSLLSANFARLEEDIRNCEAGGADKLHVDIMDGHFVPNITIGPLVVKAIRKVTRLPLGCHLMITDPDKYIPEFIEAGTNYLSVHVEAVHHLHRTLSFIKSSGLMTGIALNPLTPLNIAYDAAEYCDYIIIMTVNPGFGGQELIPSALRKCSQLRKFLDNNGLNHVMIEIDGGVKIDNVEEVVESGAQILVAGSGLFKGDITENIRVMRKKAETALAKKS